MNDPMLLLGTLACLAPLFLVIAIWRDTVKAAKPPTKPYDDIPEAILLDHRGHPIKQKKQREEDKLLPSKNIRRFMSAVLIIAWLLVIFFVAYALFQ